MTKTFAAQINRLPDDAELSAALEYLCKESNKLYKRIEQMCELYGIEFVEQEESYTSKASSLDLDEIPVYGEKPDSWEPSPKACKAWSVSLL